MGNISTVHDTFVRGLLADKQLAVDYFRSALPEHIADKLDFSTMEQLSETYVSAELEKTFSDVVHRCRRKDCAETVDISLLLEHKSSPDKYTPVQVGGYLFSGYQQQIKQGHEQLSPIIPVLLYHGRQKWEYWTLDRLFDELDQDLLGFIPKFDYVYHNLRDLSEATIRAVSNQFLVSALLVLKYAFDKQRLKVKLPEILSLGLAKGSEGQQAGLVIYGFELVDYTDKQIKEIFKGLPAEIKDTVMSTYDLLIEKGIERGRQEERAKIHAEKLEIAREMIKDGFSIQQIVKFTKLSIEEVEEKL
ncbi:hypothetical protein GCM10011386_33410 [Parapedobacter defluvii]|uniref:Transposase (putative) YhgA-like domain-containing protein n=1 Tax=Parapedobacter defluvii TaxID=2045106 RepID=A0ABQ1MDC5_9SPHI|nr:Rpn family recombination-promoting nuclease/putative transposase [Parapedobacter defluvii]RQP12125.1 MAG: Rpn family recombination-promoting nuclease/putative transposase [Parapedobacter sp.]GGC38596.1 hypothetical protein GCM10011386_33410 [Parapedobacter defluvii]